MTSEQIRQIAMSRAPYVIEIDGNTTAYYQHEDEALEFEARSGRLGKNPRRVRWAS